MGTGRLIVDATPLVGVLVVRPRVHYDRRGFFLQTYHADAYREAGILDTFVQDNHSQSVYRTIRGLHWQPGQAKLVHCVRGRILDVAVDVRPDSPTYLQHTTVILSAENAQQVYLPPGVAHGFAVLSEVAEVVYKCSMVYDPEREHCARWDDPALKIEWPFTDPILSTRDARAGWYRAA